jgi:hypothetical protein
MELKTHVDMRELKPAIAFNPPFYIFPDLASDVFPDSGRTYDV